MKLEDFYPTLNICTCVIYFSIELAVRNSSKMYPDVTIESRISRELSTEIVDTFLVKKNNLF